MNRKRTVLLASGGPAAAHPPLTVASPWPANEGSA